jgi:hypothetical protein
MANWTPASTIAHWMMKNAGYEPHCHGSARSIGRKYAESNWQFRKCDWLDALFQQSEWKSQELGSLCICRFQPWELTVFQVGKSFNLDYFIFLITSRLVPFPFEKGIVSYHSTSRLVQQHSFTYGQSYQPNLSTFSCLNIELNPAQKC